MYCRDKEEGGGRRGEVCTVEIDGVNSFRLNKLTAQLQHSTISSSTEYQLYQQMTAFDSSLISLKNPHRTLYTVVSGEVVQGMLYLQLLCYYSDYIMSGSRIFFIIQVINSLFKYEVCNHKYFELLIVLLARKIYHHYHRGQMLRIPSIVSKDSTVTW